MLIAKQNDVTIVVPAFHNYQTRKNSTVELIWSPEDILDTSLIEDGIIDMQQAMAECDGMLDKMIVCAKVSDEQKAGFLHYLSATGLGLSEKSTIGVEEIDHITTLHMKVLDKNKCCEKV